MLSGMDTNTHYLSWHTVSHECFITTTEQTTRIDPSVSGMTWLLQHDRDRTKQLFYNDAMSNTQSEIA